MLKDARFQLVIGMLLVLVAFLGIAQLVAHERYSTRGWPVDFPEGSSDVGMSTLCVNTALEQYDDATLSWALDLVADGGFVWIRQAFPWSEIEPEPGEFDWASWDPIVAGAVERGIQLIPVLTSPPAWAGAPPDPEAFARFAGAFANHYMAQLVYYQVWHNPNLGETWGGQANAYAYAEILSRVAPAIRASDPDARIVLGSLAPNVETGPVNYSEMVFLKLLHIAGAFPYFDVAALQPYGFDSAPDDRRVDPQVLNFSRPILVREVLDELGEPDKAIWASHFGWNSLPDAWPGSPSIWGSVTNEEQARYVGAALARAESEWPWMGVMCINGFQPRPSQEERVIPDAEEHWGFALVGPEGAPRPVYEAIQAWAARPALATPGVYPAGTPLADFEGSWRIGPLGADIGQSGDRVTLTFEGTGIALTVRRGPYRAFLYVTIDGKPAPALPRDAGGRAYVVLYDPLAAIETVPLAKHLAYGEHTVEVAADRGWYQWSLVDWRVANEPSNLLPWLGIGAFVIVGLLGGFLLVFAFPHLEIATVAQQVQALSQAVPDAVRTTATVGVGVIVGLSSWQVWGQGAFRRLGEGTGVVVVALAAGMFYLSPWVVLALISGAVLMVLVFLQPGVGLALTMAAAPFYLHPLSLFGKSFSLSELVLLPTVVGCVVRYIGMAHRSETRLSWRRLVRLWLPVAGFVVVGVLSAFLAQHRREALRELRLVIVEPALFFAALTLLLPVDRREWWRVIDGFVLSAVVIAVVGLVQYFILGDVITAEGGIPRLRSIYGSPNNVGLYLGRAWPVMLALGMCGGQGGQRHLRAFWSDLKTAPRRLGYVLALPVVGVALVLSLSRGAILLGLPAGALTLGLLAGRKWRRATVIALAVFAVIVIPLLQTPRFAGLFDTTSGTTFLRLALWRSAWSMFRDYPIFGVGPDNFLYAYRTRYVLPAAWEEFNLSHPHNWVLDFGSRLGILGLIGFLGLQIAFWIRIAYALRKGEGETRALAIGLAASMVVSLAHGLVDASFFYIDLAFVFFLLMGAAVWCDWDSRAAAKAAGVFLQEGPERVFPG
ncbi:MAG: O-antigen ligase family protein [Anaerolineae bacterium]|nr:O-antigen ligase family protein [Anaerolineae bacterium]